ncbi:MAG: TrkH family potassium uptake protein [bacterium]|nr:TrkH family potassium uptake protein [bacterium]
MSATPSPPRRTASANNGLTARWNGTARLVGAVIALTGVSMLAPLVVSMLYGDWRDTLLLAIASATTVAIGAAMWRSFQESKDLSVVEAFGAVGLAWLAMAAFGAVPYLLTGSIPSITGAFFESASGFTATGSSVVADPAQLSHAILFWRALTHWLGGMGVIVLAVAVLPLVGVGAVQLAKAEAPGPVPERVTPRFRETAKRLWLVFAALTAVQIVLLALGEMNLFDATAHSFATISGGGFGTRADSMSSFSAYSQWVVIMFMIAGGTSFALHYRALRNPVRYVRNAEFRLYMLVLLGLSVAVVVGTWGSSFHATVRDAVFTVTSILTTTGFATTDFGAWRPVLQLLVLGLMFVGAMAGSTSGSVKVFRLEILWSATRAHMRRYLHPQGVFVARSGGEPVGDDVARSVRVFVVLYLFAFMSGTLLLSIISSVVRYDMGLISTASAVAASLGNVGPGLDAVGPTHNFAAIPDLGKWLLSALMIFGRLEIIPIMLIFTREFWRR